MVCEESLVTKWMYKNNPEFKGNDDDFKFVNTIYIKKYIPKSDIFIVNANHSIEELEISANDVCINFTSIKPLFVLSLKAFYASQDVTYGLVINPYFSEWKDPSKMCYTPGMEINIKEAVEIFSDNRDAKNNLQRLRYNFMMYNQLEKDKSPKYPCRNTETLSTIYGYYNSDIQNLLIELFTNPKLSGFNWIEYIKEFRGLVHMYLRHVHGLNITSKKIFNDILAYGKNDNRVLGDLKYSQVHNIYKMPLSFEYIEPTSIFIKEWSLDIDIEKIKKEYSPYNIVILKVVDTEHYNGLYDMAKDLNTYLMLFNNKSNLSGEVEFGLNNDEIAKLLDFNKG